MTSPVRVAVLVSRIRVEEKLLLAALEAAGAAVQVINDDDLVLPVVDTTFPPTPPLPATFPPTPPLPVTSPPTPPLQGEGSPPPSLAGKGAGGLGG
ncbi:MAG: hypothetical protein ACP5UQ_10410, partial [Anaerolineae bacterium]